MLTMLLTIIRYTIIKNKRVKPIGDMSLEIFIVTGYS